MKKIVYYIKGDGIGPEIWNATRPVLDTALRKAYNSEHSIEWKELLAGEKAYAETGEYLPETTLAALRDAELAIKGPMATPVGGGIRSLNVALRQIFDLYACVRPIKYFPGIGSPVKHPELVDMIIFRENTEDLYKGIEFAASSPEARKLEAFLRDELGADVRPESAFGIKPMSAFGSKRLIRKAIDYALSHNKDSVTLMHKGNIMKFTEGAFKLWGYELAAEEYAGKWVSEEEAENHPGKLVIRDRIADNMFQQVLTRPAMYSVIAAPNLNGDYISDALAAQVGGLGLAPGVNMSDTLAFFEATHGTAPKYVGKDAANPGSLILSGAMLLEHAGWPAAAELVHSAMGKVIAAKTVPGDLARQMDNAKTVGCSEFGELLCAAMG